MWKALLCGFMCHRVEVWKALLCGLYAVVEWKCGIELTVIASYTSANQDLHLSITEPTIVKTKVGIRRVYVYSTHTDHGPPAIQEVVLLQVYHRSIILFT